MAWPIEDHLKRRRRTQRNLDPKRLFSNLKLVSIRPIFEIIIGVDRFFFIIKLFQIYLHQPSKIRRVKTKNYNRGG